MAKHVLCFVVAVLLSLLQFPATAQDSTKLRRVGFIFTGSEEDSRAGLDVLYASFADLGYHAGKNLVLDARYAEGRFERGEELASELLRSGAEVLIAGGYQLSAAALRVTRTLPIVGVGCGIEHLAASLARPGGNVTGVTCQSPDLIGEQLQLLSGWYRQRRGSGCCSTAIRPQHRQWRRSSNTRPTPSICGPLDRSTTAGGD